MNRALLIALLLATLQLEVVGIKTQSESKSAIQQGLLASDPDDTSPSDPDSDLLEPDTDDVTSAEALGEFFGDYDNFGEDDDEGFDFDDFEEEDWEALLELLAALFATNSTGPGYGNSTNSTGTAGS